MVMYRLHECCPLTFSSPDPRRCNHFNTFLTHIWAHFLANDKEYIDCILFSNEGKIAEIRNTALMILCRISQFSSVAVFCKKLFLSSVLLMAFNGCFLSEEEKEGGNLELLISHSPPESK